MVSSLKRISFIVNFMIRKTCFLIFLYDHKKFLRAPSLSLSPSFLTFCGFVYVHFCSHFAHTILATQVTKHLIKIALSHPAHLIKKGIHFILSFTFDENVKQVELKKKIILWFKKHGQ